MAATGTPLLLEGLDARMPGLPGGPWPEPVTQTRLMPVTSGTGGRTSGIAVIGISPRLRFDERYQVFCEQVASNLSAAVTNALAYQEERARAERLAEIDRAKTAFFSNVSHEFRTPLTLMLSPLEEILAKPPAGVLPDNRALATVAHRNGLRLLRLVNGLLDFSRVEAGRARAAFRLTDLPRFHCRTRRNFRSLCEQAGLTLTVDCPHPRRARAARSGDVGEGGAQPPFQRLQVHARRKDHRANRAGGRVRRAHRRRHRHRHPRRRASSLFDRFHRVEGAQGRTFEGTGIGLALVQEMVRLHHGSIHVESEPGRGSTFRVSLPLAQDGVGTAVEGFTPILTAAR